MATLPLRTPISGEDCARGVPPGPSEAQPAVLAQRVPRLRVVCVTCLAVVGVLALWPTVLLLWSLWTTDALKSIGGIVPPASLLLLLRVWQAHRWTTRGTAWGLALLAATVAAVHLRDRAVLEMVLTPSWSITLPPHSLVAFAYGSGVVLLFGGRQLWKAALFPLLLLLLVNPVPHAFTRLVDLPLQHVSAQMARGLAHGLGQHLSPDQLTLMFTPDFGMFIAPGCDGIRGSITMGLLALIAGYLYQFRLRAWALLVAGAVLLGYAFNLLRLCVLVFYYVVALHWPWLQGHAEGADYLLGASLFFGAAMLLFAAIRRLGPGRDLRIPPLPVPPAPRLAAPEAGGFWLRCAAFSVLIALGCAPYARGWWPSTGARAAAPRTASTFPAALGAYTLRRSWPETLPTGQTIFEWAEYAKPGAPFAVAVGVSPVLGAHDTLLCHAARGEAWLWHGSLSLTTLDGAVPFSGTLLNDGATQSLEATTVCTASSCGQWASERRHFGLVYSRPDLGTLRTLAAARPIPVLLRVETPEAMLPRDKAQAQLTAELRNFMAGVSTESLTQPYRRP